MTGLEIIFWSYVWTLGAVCWCYTVRKLIEVEA